jgi:hypothetical protein
VLSSFAVGTSEELQGAAYKGDKLLTANNPPEKSEI